MQTSSYTTTAVAIVAFALATSEQAAPVKATTTLKIATFNIRYAYLCSILEVVDYLTLNATPLHFTPPPSNTRTIAKNESTLPEEELTWAIRR